MQSYWIEIGCIHCAERTLAGQTVTYSYIRWENMMKVLEDGRMNLDNTLLSENLQINHENVQKHGLNPPHSA